MAIKAYSVLTNIAAGLATASVVIDSHKMGKNAAYANLIKGSGDDLVEDAMGAYKLNYESEKYGKIKQDIFKLKMDMGYRDFFHKTGGYFKGLASGIAHNLNTIGFSVLTFVSKKKVPKIIGAVGVGVSVLWNFIKNGTNLLEKNDYLKY